MINSTLLYVRVSSKEQEREGYSLDAQEKLGIDYALRNNLKIVKRWKVSESAWKEERTAFSEMLEYETHCANYTLTKLQQAHQLLLPISTQNTGRKPVTITLNQNYPNPFNPTTVISWQLPVSTPVKLTVYNPAGQKIATLVNERLSTGFHQIEFDASILASGLYIYRLEAGKYVETKKMFLIK